MKILSSCLIMLFFAATASAADGVRTLTLKIPSVVNAPLYSALYAGDASFLELDKAVLAKKFDKNSSNSYMISQLHTGAYAVAVYQDSNRNGELDMSFFGAPKEPYVFSGNPDATFGPPGYDACRFELSEDKTLEIFLQRK